MNTSRLQAKMLAGILLLIYILFRYIAPNFLDQFGYYASYAFEILFCLNAVFLFRSRLKFKLNVDRKFIFGVGGSILAGIIVFVFTKPLGLSIPFDLKNPEFIFLLIVFGPILEEFIFRFAFWHALSILVTEKHVLALTTIIFSYSHFHAYFFVPPDFYGFIFYQTLYTLLMGWWLGRNYKKSGVITAPIALHIACNFGFFLGNLI